MRTNVWSVLLSSNTWKELYKQLFNKACLEAQVGQDELRVTLIRKSRRQSSSVWSGPPLPCQQEEKAGQRKICGFGRDLPAGRGTHHQWAHFLCRKILLKSHVSSHSPASPPSPLGWPPLQDSKPRNVHAWPSGCTPKSCLAPLASRTDCCTMRALFCHILQPWLGN